MEVAKVNNTKNESTYKISFVAKREFVFRNILRK
jgi:hypothetical protein